MGYYSDFEITANPEPGDFGSVLEKYSGGCHFEDWGRGAWHTGDSTKWYTFNKDVEKLSNDFPDVNFTFQREGEDSGDAERFDMKNGVEANRKKLGWIDD